MSTFLDTLKDRLAESSKRYQEVSERFKIAQTEHQNATAKLQKTQAEYTTLGQEFGSWQKAVEVETRKEQAAALTAGIPPSPEAEQKSSPPVSQAAIAPEVNKTDLIREVLQQHPGGMIPADVWKAAKTHIPDRTYVYSVLKRLKDRGEISVKRGKYFFRMTPKPEEAKQQITVQ
jgi:hypothetical protein